VRESFATTTRGLRRDSRRMRLFEKAKRFGIWNPADIDFRQDAEDWQRLTDDERQRGVNFLIWLSPLLPHFHLTS